MERSAGDLCLHRLDLDDGEIREQQVIPPHQRVADRHQLAEHLAGRVGDADVVAKALGHLLDAVESLEQRRRHHDLRRQVEGRHDVASDVEVEELIGAAQLDVRSQRHRIERLHQRIQKLVDGDRLAGLVALLEIAALEHLRDVVVGGQLDEPVAAKRDQPAAVELHDGLLRIEQLEDLRLVGLGVALDLGRRQRRARLRSTRRVADHRREIADDEDHRVTQILEVLHLADEHRVTQVQVRRRRVEADLHDERAPEGEPGAQVVEADDVDTALGETFDLLVDGHRRIHALLP